MQSALGKHVLELYLHLSHLMCLLNYQEQPVLIVVRVEPVSWVVLLLPDGDRIA